MPSQGTASPVWKAAAVAIMRTFIEKASNDGICGSSSLGSIITKQLRQSGFLEHLPELLRAAADLVVQVDSQDDQALLDDMAASREQPGSLRASLGLVQLHLRVDDLLSVAHSISQSWPHLCRAIDAAALQLAVVTLQHLSRCIKILPADSAEAAQPSLSSSKLWQPSTAATTTIQRVLPRVAKDAAGNASQQLPLPDAWWMTQAACLNLAMARCPCVSLQQLQQLQQPPSGTTGTDGITAGSSSSRSTPVLGHPAGSSNQAGGSSSSGTAITAAAWRFACTHHQDLPWPLLHLVQALGCDSKAILFSCALIQLSATRWFGKPPTVAHAALVKRTLDDLGDATVLINPPSITAAAVVTTQEQDLDSQAVSGINRHMKQLQQLASVVLLEWSVQLELTDAASRGTRSAVLHCCQILLNGLVDWQPVQYSDSARDIVSFCSQPTQAPTAVLPAPSSPQGSHGQQQQQQQQQSAPPVAAAAAGQQADAAGQGSEGSAVETVVEGVQDQGAPLSQTLLTASLKWAVQLSSQALHFAQTYTEDCTATGTNSCSSSSRRIGGSSSSSSEGSGGSGGSRDGDNWNPVQKALPMVLLIIAQLQRCAAHVATSYCPLVADSPGLRQPSLTGNPRLKAASNCSAAAALSGSSSSSGRCSSASHSHGSYSLAEAQMMLWLKYAPRLLPVAEASVRVGLNSFALQAEAVGTFLHAHCCCLPPRSLGSSPDQRHFLGLAFSLLKSCAAFSTAHLSNRQQHSQAMDRAAAAGVALRSAHGS